MFYKDEKLEGKVCVFWKDKKTGVEDHGGAIAPEIAEDYLRRTRSSLPDLDFEMRDAVTGLVVEPKAFVQATTLAIGRAAGGPVAEPAEAAVVGGIDGDGAVVEPEEIVNA